MDTNLKVEDTELYKSLIEFGFDPEMVKKVAVLTNNQE